MYCPLRGFSGLTLISELLVLTLRTALIVRTSDVVLLKFWNLCEVLSVMKWRLYQRKEKQVKPGLSVPPNKDQTLNEFSETLLADETNGNRQFPLPALKYSAPPDLSFFDALPANIHCRPYCSPRRTLRQRSYVPPARSRRQILVALECQACKVSDPDYLTTTRDRCKIP